MNASDVLEQLGPGLAEAGKRLLPLAELAKKSYDDADQNTRIVVGLAAFVVAGKVLRRLGL